MTIDEAREIALSFPKVEEYPLFGSQAFRVGKRLLACRPKIDPEHSLLLKVPSQLEREFLLSSQPEVYYLQPHYEGFDCVLIKLDLMDAGEFRELFETAWRTYAPKRVLAAWEKEVNSSERFSK